VSLLKLRDATFWDRFWARCIDVSIVVIPSIFIFAFFADVISESKVFYYLFFPLVASLIAFFYEYFFLILFEATIGKLIFKMVVISENGDPLNIKGCRLRSWNLIKKALWFFVFYPWVQIGLAFDVNRRFKNKQSTAWDNGLSLVKQKPISIYRWGLGLVLFLYLTGFAFALHKAVLVKIAY
jgi:uncharacterized RDD family membrane protein YckC